MAYSREDTPQFTASELAVSLSSALSASSVSASLASASLASASASLADASRSSGTATTGASSTSVGASQSEATAQGDTTATTEKKSGLGTGALVGIIIGAIVIIALLGAIAFFMWRRKNNAANTPSHHGVPTAAEMSGAPLMSGGPVEHYKPHAYPDTYAHQVQPGNHQYPVELDGPSYAQPVVHEMGTQK